MNLEIGVDNLFPARTSSVPASLPALRSRLRPGLLLCLTPADFLVCGRPGFPKDLLEFFSL